eukprot:1156841-Pelagomonas_calceolata.AAC.11
MRELGCCTDEQGQGVGNNKYWACPTRANLNEDENFIIDQALSVKQTCTRYLGAKLGARRHQRNMANFPPAHS